MIGLRAPRRLPEGATGDAGLLLVAKGLRSFANGYVSTVLPVYLVRPGYDALDVGVPTTAALLGSAACPPLAGYLTTLSGFGRPPIIGGGLKVGYDPRLRRQFARVRPPEEMPR